MEFSAKQIAEYLGGEIFGDANVTVCTFAKIEEGVPGALSFLSNPKYVHYIYETKSSIVLVNKDFVPEQPISATLVKVDNAYESLAKLLTLYDSMKPKRKGIDPLAYVRKQTRIFVWHSTEKCVLGYTLLLYSYVELLCAQFPNLRFLILPFT